MIEFHVLTPRGSELIVQVVGGKPVLPPVPPTAPAGALAPAAQP